jgi:hypothetical protein
MEGMDGRKLINAEDEIFGVSTDLGIGESFRGKADGEGDGGGVRSNRLEGGMDFGWGMGRDALDRDNKGAKTLAFGAALAGTESQEGKRAGANVGDTGATVDGAAGDFESKSR